jgi:hypothetical protein
MRQEGGDAGQQAAGWDQGMPSGANGRGGRRCCSGVCCLLCHSARAPAEVPDAGEQNRVHTSQTVDLVWAISHDKALDIF